MREVLELIIEWVKLFETLVHDPMKQIFFIFIFFAFYACSNDTQSNPPTLSITYPKEGDMIRTSNIRIKGEASNTNIVHINGEQTDVVGGIWEIVLPFSQGEQSVNATLGSVKDSVNFRVDSLGPKLVITEPPRGKYYTEGIDPETIWVRGKVEEPARQLDILTINEQIIQPKADGSFSFEYRLKLGLNEINVAAIDKAGNKTQNIRGVMYGVWTDPTSAIDPGINLFIRESMMGELEKTFREMVTPEMVKSYIESTFSADQLTISSISFDPIDVKIILKKGYIYTDFFIKNLKMKGVFMIVDTPINTTIEIDQMRATQNIIPFITSDGGFDLRFENEKLELEEKDVRFSIGTEDSDALRSLAVDVAKAGFGYLLSESVFDQLLDPKVLIRKTELLGRELVFELKLKTLDIFTDGILIKTAIIFPANRPTEVRKVPGALSRLPGAASGGEPVGDIFFTSSQYAFDRISHGIWRSGLFNIELHDKEFAGHMLPFELTAAGLALALDSRITHIAGPDAPVILRLRPQLPPTTELDDKTNKIQVKMGEFLVDFILIDQGKEILIATISAFFDLAVTIKVKGFLVELSFETTLRADLIAEPEIDLEDRKTEQLFEDLIALIPKIFEENLDLRGEADIFWVTLNHPDILVHGEKKDYASFGMEVEPNLEALPAAP